MKVLLVNGSPHKTGVIFTALSEIVETLKTEGIEGDIFWLGNDPVASCIGCKACYESGKCFRDDVVNEFLDIMDDYDGYIFGSAVHFAAATGALSSFMDRIFMGKISRFYLKPAAAVVSCRRAGATAAFDEINKYFTISNMPVVSSKYWNQIHGSNAQEAKEDLEGLQTMRTLARNMAYMLKSFKAAELHGVRKPELEEPIKTSFIR